VSTIPFPAVNPPLQSGGTCPGDIIPTFTTSSIVRVGTRAPNPITEFPIHATGIPSAIARGPDGNLWLAEGRTGYAIGRFSVDHQHTFSEFPITDDAYPRSPVCGPDDTVWFSTVPFGATPPAQYEGRIDLRTIDAGHHSTGGFFSDDDGCRTTPGLFGGLTEVFDVFGQITRERIGRDA
jgi:hypothetical protein